MLVGKGCQEALLGEHHIRVSSKIHNLTLTIWKMKKTEPSRWNLFGGATGALCGVGEVSGRGKFVGHGAYSPHRSQRAHHTKEAKRKGEIQRRFPMEEGRG